MWAQASLVHQLNCSCRGDAESAQWAWGGRQACFGALVLVMHTTAVQVAGLCFPPVMQQQQQQQQQQPCGWSVVAAGNW